MTTRSNACTMHQLPTTALAGLVIAWTVALTPIPATAAGSCIATTHKTMTRFAHAQGFSSGAHTGCSPGLYAGAATYCFRHTLAPSGPGNQFFVRWPSVTARTMDDTGGCSFMCNTGNCRVGNDGLPVELLSFGVE